MTRMLLRTAMTTDQAGQMVKLDYYMLSEYTSGFEQYGAEIRMQRARQRERCMVKRITLLPERMQNIIGVLAEAHVTPATMREVLEEIL